MADKIKTSEVLSIGGTMNRVAKCRDCGWDYRPGLGRPNYQPRLLPGACKTHVANTGHTVITERKEVTTYYPPEVSA